MWKDVLWIQTRERHVGKREGTSVRGAVTGRVRASLNCEFFFFLSFVSFLGSLPASSAPDDRG